MTDAQGKPQRKKPKITQESAREMLAFLEACLDCEDSDSLHDFVVNHAEDVVDRAYGYGSLKGGK